ncbi:MAG: hypothetical protein CVV30_09560 [Methanomicrobiales archaeon HGW-Methanomicrobiales-1]|nr:MAG: hypothetical protein CVV30_09560 [Methanomicrobiales archaeon HGW-Methanomicrobiales-1]
MVILLCCISAASAFSVTSISIDPSGSLIPGTPVTASYKIDTSGFASGGDLQFYTDLDSPLWTYTILVNGVENLRPALGGRTLTITGFELSYKTGDDVAVRATLEGKAPTVTETTDKTIIRIQEIGSNGAAITSTKVERTGKVINTGEVPKVIAERDTELQTYRTHIDEKAVLGIDTSDAEAKYNDAKQKIDSARARPTNQYAEALADLTAAQASISDGEKALDKAWAENEVAAAQIPINNVDTVIAWFKGNQSTANDQQLPTIVTKREVALSYISTANDQIASGEYTQARSKAQEALAKGTESYNDAIARQKQLSSGFIWPQIQIPGGIFIVLGVVVVILVAVGIVIYRKRSRWDELG